MNLSLYASQVAEEINDDIVAKLVPAGIATFRDLHLYVDANDYVAGVRPQSAGEAYDAYTEVANAIEAEVDAWLKAGRPNFTYEIPVTFIP